MKLLDNPYNYDEQRQELDMLVGNITRIRLSSSPEEIISSLGFAIDRLSMIAYSRIKELALQGENNGTN